MASKLFVQDDFVARFAAVLERTKFAGASDEYRRTPAYQRELHDHLIGRMQMFSDMLVPWLQRAGDLSSMTVLEVGSGTGSSTAAIAPLCRGVHCFEIDPASVDAASERLRLLNITNVTFDPGLFDEASPFLRARQAQADLVLLAATLEHMTFGEAQEVLRAAWSVLRPGGLLAITNTPNRLSPLDRHTSHLPFFMWLPMEIRTRYAEQSSRTEFAQSIMAAPDRSIAVTRWGCGLSYHDLELAIGPDVHTRVVCDGYEPEILTRFPLNREDSTLTQLFANYSVPAHRAFARHNLFVLLRR